MLDGIYVDKRSHDVLPTTIGFQQTDLRSRGVHLYAGLGQHGRIYDHLINPGTWAFGYHDHLHLLLYFLNDEKIKVGSLDP